ncbi:hypothetical protein LLEC1_02858 [Akanthomyces lecanii]|uniref:Uncharacterized protein n=1 Tax=Cordyceps confragosa TaxID=2714763 RepID=A0A179HZK5_CORDF|nr:hypothetical protein LLEC1_02858 [Akanthomyces lecanii]
MAAEIQLLQLNLTFIRRRIRGLRFSQLETVALSFAICGVLMTYMDCHKPQNIDRPEQLKVEATVRRDVLREKAATTRLDVLPEQATETQEDKPFTSRGKTYYSFWAIMLNRRNASNTKQGSKQPKAPRIPNDSIPLTRVAMRLAQLYAYSHWLLESSALFMLWHGVLSFRAESRDCLGTWQRLFLL